MNDTARNRRLRTIFASAAVMILSTSASAADSTLAFTRDQQALVLLAGSAKPTVLAKGNSAALSPSGKAAAYLSPDANGETKSIVSISIDGKAKRTVYRSNRSLRNLSWSTKGKLLFIELNGAKEELRYIEPGIAVQTKSKLIPKPSAANAIFNPRWSPDGGSVIYHDLETIFRIGLNGQVISKWTVKQITGRANCVDSACAFSLCPTDANLMLCTWTVKGTPKFEAAMGGEPNSALFIFNIATGTRKRLSPPDMVCMDPAWSRDGKTIYLCGYREAHYRQAYPFRIYSIKPDGSSLSEICKGECPNP